MSAQLNIFILLFGGLQGLLFSLFMFKIIAANGPTEFGAALGYEPFKKVIMAYGGIYQLILIARKQDIN